MKRRWAAWASFWDRREHPLPLALVRIGVACVLLYDFAAVASHGLVGVLWAPQEEGGLAYRSEDAFASGDVLFGVCVLSAVSLAIGLFSRSSAAVLLVAYAQLAMLLPEADRGIDMLLRSVLVILAFSRAGATWSLDAKLRSGSFAAPPDLEVPAWPRYLVVVQLVWTYFSAATHKLQSPWTPIDGFSALHYVLQDPHFARWDFAWISSFHPLTRLATFGTVAFEWSAPLSLLAWWYEATADRPGRLRRLFNVVRFRRAWIATGVVFHLALLVTLRLGIFPLGMLALYPAFFSPDELLGLVRRRISASSRE